MKLAGKVCHSPGRWHFCSCQRHHRKSNTFTSSFSETACEKCPQNLHDSSLKWNHAVNYNIFFFLLYLLKPSSDPGFINIKCTICRSCCQGSYNKNETKWVSSMGSWELLSAFLNKHHRWWKNLPDVTRVETYTAVAMFKSFVHVVSRRIWFPPGFLP